MLLDVLSLCRINNVDTVGEHDDVNSELESRTTFKLSDLLSHNANAVRWQVWTALLLHMLLCQAAHLNRWGHSFTRLAVVRSAMC